MKRLKKLFVKAIVVCLIMNVCCGCSTVPKQDTTVATETEVTAPVVSAETMQSNEPTAPDATLAGEVRVQDEVYDPDAIGVPDLPQPNDDSGNQGVDQWIALNEVRHEDAVDNQSDVIADQQGGDEVALAPVEAVEDACGETAVFTLHFQQHLVAGHESNLQSGEECTEKQYDANADNHRRREDGVSGGTSVPVESLSMSPTGKSPTELVTA